MTLEAWALFCLTEALLCLKPGVSTLAVVSLSATRGAGAGLLATLGVLAANAVYFALSASGLVVLHALSAEVFTAIKWAGAAYLIWTGAMMIWRSFRPSEAQRTATVSKGRAFLQGFVTQGANPNLLVYFAAILPQFVDPAEPLAPQVAILAFSSFVIEGAIVSGYALLAARAGQGVKPRLRATLERAGGGLLIAAGAGLATLKRA
jgi:homoserine/homoserine lactone efflux protein